MYSKPLLQAKPPSFNRKWLHGALTVYIFLMRQETTHNRFAQDKYYFLMGFLEREFQGLEINYLRKKWEYI